MDIQDYPNYIIYNNGDIFSKTKNKIITKDINKNGYVYSHLYKNSKQKTITNHKLVATHYIPNPHNYTDIDHIDSDKTNNNVNNLRWCNRTMNNEYKKSKYYCNHSGGFHGQIKRSGLIYRKWYKKEEDMIEWVNKMKVLFG